ncbi:retrotransposon protein, putative, ty1-copia subclass [Tanacetum coccineum]|uniref:Retrotransposon protein, putative, ty1-copia subclass n=1 Tax=Tanacetum coccineum TaxID=301880 RepID=A0ABQ5HNE3_9ASTR
MGNSIPMLQDVKSYLGKCFAMKDLGEAAYILGIKIYRDRSRRLIGLCQSAYIEKILKRFHMENSKRGSIPMQDKLRLSKSQGASTPAELKRMQSVPYASAVGSIMYAVRCTRPDVAFAQKHKQAISTENSLQNGWICVRFEMRLFDWKSAKQSIFATSSAKAEYIAAFDASKEAVWVRKFISGLGVVLDISVPKFTTREVIEFGDIKLEKVHTDDNLADPFTKALAFPKHSELTRNIGMLPASSFIFFVLNLDLNFVTISKEPKEGPFLQYSCKEPVSIFSRFEIQVQGSCNGLKCLSQDNGYVITSLVVVHPLKKECYELPPFPLRIGRGMGRESCGLGFDTSTNTWKMVCVLLKEYAPPDKPDMVKKNLCTMVHEFVHNSLAKNTPSSPLIQYQVIGFQKHLVYLLYWIHVGFGLASGRACLRVCVSTGRGDNLVTGFLILGLFDLLVTTRVVVSCFRCFLFQVSIRVCIILLLPFDCFQKMEGICSSFMTWKLAFVNLSIEIKNRVANIYPNKLFSDWFLYPVTSDSRLDTRKSIMDNSFGSAEEVDHVRILKSCNGLLLCAVVQVGRTSCDIEIQMYSLETGNWSLCSDEFNYFSCDRFDSAIYWNDAFHWLETENRQLKHYKLNIEDHGHPIITTIEIPHGLHQGRNFFQSFGGDSDDPVLILMEIPQMLHLERKFFESHECLLLVCRDDIASREVTIYEMMEGCSVWSVRYLVNTEEFMNPLSERWSIWSTI